MRACEVCFKRNAERDGACSVCHGMAEEKRSITMKNLIENDETDHDETGRDKVKG